MDFHFKTKSFLNQFKWYLVTVFLIGIIVGCAAPRANVSELSSGSGYTCIIDAGSSGSRIYIYEISSLNAEIPVFRLLGSEKVKPGISDYENNPEKAEKNLGNLIEAAKSVIDPANWKSTPLYVLSTAGMRLLSETKRETILKKVSDYLIEEDSFDFKTAVVISGAYEGLYAWLAVNYLDDLFDPIERREGILEMGGASTQIAFSPSSTFSKHKVRRELRGKSYDIFTRSYLYMGANEARALAGSTNCYPPGAPTDAAGVEGTGGFRRCTEDIRETFDSLCENLERGGPHCVFKQDPPPAMEGEFFALSSFYFTFKYLGLDSSAELLTLRQKGTELCSTDWAKLVGGDVDAVKNPYLKYYCFNTAYFWQLLKYGYRLSHYHAAIIPKNDFEGWGEINWTLGALIDITLGNEPMPYEPGEPFHN